MLVVNGDRSSIPGSEKKVIDWLRSWSMPGVAVSGCIIPSRNGGREGGEADLVIITPDNCAAIEVKGLKRRVRGAVMSCPANDQWTVSGETKPLMHVRPGDTNPLDQVSARMFDLKALVPDEFVAGAVLVIPLPGSSVRLSVGTMPTGRDVLLGDEAAELRRWLDRSTSRSAGTWTADKAAKLLQLLGVTSVGETDLVDEGFPTKPTAVTASADLTPITSLRPARPLATVHPLRAFDPTAIVIPERSAAAESDNFALGRTGNERLSILMPPQQLPQDLLSHRTNDRSSVAIAAVVTLAVLVGGGWFIAAAAGDPSPERPAEQSGTSLTTSTEPAPPQTPAPLFGDPKPLWSSAPTKTTPAAVFDFSGGGSTTCFPFQPDC